MSSNGVVLVNIDYGILGRTALRIDGALRDNWGRPREHAILATLLIHPGRTVSFPTLIEWAWPDESAAPRDPASTLHTHAARLRKSLDRLPTPPVLSAGNRGYRLEVDPSLIDYHRFRTLVTRARDHAAGNDPVNAAAEAERALALWRGQPVEDIHSGPAQAWRTRVVQDEWLPAHLVLLQALLATQRYDQALVRLDEAQAEYPLDVNLAKLRLSVLHGMCRSEEAVQYYITIRGRLREQADDQALHHLREHNEKLAGSRGSGDPPQASGPRIVPRQLPHDVAHFVGRSSQLTALDETVRRSNGKGIVIVHGMPGVGKTALTVHWAHRRRTHFPDGDLYVDLHGFSGSPPIPPATVVDDFLILLGYPPRKDQTLREKELLLSQLLADRKTLVVLDNARDTAHVERLVPLLTNCLVIVTSRQRLPRLSRVTGARLVSVVPMNTAEGTALLHARLSHGPGPHGGVGERISALCGGLPLVITILAQHIAHRESARLADFLEQLTTHRLIDEIGMDGDQAANTTTFFSWSYESLDASERRLFRLLGRHPGPDISLDAACACDGRPLPDTRTSLGVLVGAHLIEQPHSFDRYQFHDLLRDFARDRVHQDEQAEADRRMIAFYLSSANHAFKALYPGRPTAPELPATERLAPVSFGTPAEAKSWFDRERTTLTAVIAFAVDQGHNAQAWRLADTVATVFDRHGYYEDSRAIRTLAVSAARAANDPDGEASSLASLGLVQMILGDHTEARRCFTAALRFAQESNRERAQGSALHLLGRLELACGNLSEAVPLLRRCLRIMQSTSDDEGLSWAYGRLGHALRLLDQHDEALVYLHQAQFHAQRIGETSAHATALAEIGSIFHDRGDHQQAATYSRQALAVVDSAPIADLAISVHVCQTLAAITNELGALDQAYHYAHRAVEISASTHNVSAEARSWEVLAELHHSHAEVPDAVTAWRRASELYDRIGNHRQSTVIRSAMRTADAGKPNVPQARTGSPTPKPIR